MCVVELRYLHNHDKFTALRHNSQSTLETYTRGIILHCFDPRETHTLVGLIYIFGKT